MQRFSQVNLSRIVLLSFLLIAFLSINTLTATAEITDGRILYMPFTNDTGDTIVDESGLGHNGLNHNAALMQLPNGEKYRVFNSTASTYISIPSTAYLNETTHNSIVFWFQTEYNGATSGKIYAKSNTEPRVLQANVWGNGTLSYGANAWQQSTNYAYNDNVWHCYVATWDSTPNSVSGVTVFVDKVLISTTNRGTYNGFTPTITQVCIGSDYSGVSGFATINLSEISVYNRTLTAADVNELYNENAATYGHTIRIGTMGDSITAGHNGHDPNPDFYDAADNPMSSYQYYLLKNFNNTVIFNRGIGGQNTTQMKARHTTDIINLDVDKAIYLGGVNDLAQNAPLETIENNLYDMWMEARANNIEPIAGTLLPWNNGNAVQKTKLDDLNTWIRQNASDNHILVIDFYQVMVDPETPQNMPAELVADGVHPTVLGYQYMGNNITTLDYTPPAAPVSNFSASVFSGTNPLTIDFTDLSEGTIDSYAWDFNGDGAIDSTEQNPSHTYQTPGDYTASLTVSNDGGSSTATIEISVLASPVTPILTMELTEISDFIVGVAGLMSAIKNLVVASMPLIVIFILIGFVIGIIAAIVLYVRNLILY